MTEEKKASESIFSSMPSKFAFWAGVVTATAVFAAVGFAVMLTLVLKGVEFDSGSKTGKSNSNSAAAKVNANSDKGGAAAVASGSVDPDSLRNVRGSGDLTIVEYSDTECPFCKRFHPTMQQVIDEYDGKVAWSYKHFPLASLHPKAEREAVATECAGNQGKFWEYIDLVFERTPSNNGLEDAELFTIASDIGLDVDQFTTCVENNETVDTVRADLKEAQALGGTGTPFSVIIDENGDVLKTIPGALQYDAIASLLDSLL